MMAENIVIGPEVRLEIKNGTLKIERNVDILTTIGLLELAKQYLLSKVHTESNTDTNTSNTQNIDIPPQDTLFKVDKILSGKIKDVLKNDDDNENM